MLSQKRRRGNVPSLNTLLVTCPTCMAYSLFDRFSQTKQQTKALKTNQSKAALLDMKQRTVNQKKHGKTFQFLVQVLEPSKMKFIFSQFLYFFISQNVQFLTP